MAVICTAVSDPTAAAAVAVNVALVAPAATVTLAGSLSKALLSVSVTDRPPAGAARLSVTVQVALPGAVKLAGVQVRPLNCGRGDTVTVAVCVTPPALAVTVTVWVAATEPAVAVKFALVAPDPTVTEAGTGSAALLLDKFTGNALVAALFKVTVQVVDWPGERLPGAQLNDDNCTGASSVTVKFWLTEFSVAVI